MTLPSLHLNPILLNSWEPHNIDVLVGRNGEHAEPLRTLADLDAALVVVRSFLDKNEVGSIGIVGVKVDDDTGRTYTVQQQHGKLRVYIQTVVFSTLEVKKAEPLIASQPHLFYTWGGVQGFARMWFEFTV